MMGHPLPGGIREHGLQRLEVGVNVTEKSKTHGIKTFGAQQNAAQGPTVEPKAHML
jgi:hypothetical protein